VQLLYARVVRSLDGTRSALTMIVSHTRIPLLGLFLRLVASAGLFAPS